jgi:peroxiredoxin
MEHNLAKPSWWIRPLLFVAFLYNLFWGFTNIFFPEYIFIVSDLEIPNYLYIWQTLGAIEVVLAVGYFIALINPYRHWAPIVIGFTFKILSSVIFFKAAIANNELLHLGNYIFIDNLIWLIPFTAIMVNVYRRSFRSDELLLEAFDDEYITYDMFDTSEGIDLKEMSERWPTMVVFLRHFGCTFCRETLQDIAKQRKAIEAQGIRILLVHMLEDTDEARRQVIAYGQGLDDIPLLSDPEGILYKKFKLRRGTLWQLLGGKVLFRGFVAGVLKGNGIGKEMGDMTQMPGIFVVYKSEIVKKYVHKSSADRPEYTKLASFKNKEAA